MWLGGCLFFQAEDGIRDLYVTGVQTCALPISEDPRVVVAVVLDRPAKGIYGGTVAAPVFREVAGYALRHMEVPPSLGGGDTASGAATGTPSAPDGDVSGSAPADAPGPDPLGPDPPGHPRGVPRAPPATSGAVP